MVDNTRNTRLRGERNLEARMRPCVQAYIVGKIRLSVFQDSTKCNNYLLYNIFFGLL
jgi:hypothetical protein